MVQKVLLRPESHEFSKVYNKNGCVNGRANTHGKAYANEARNIGYIDLTKSRSRLVSDHIAKLGACHHHYLEDDEDEVPSTSNMAW